MEMWSAAALEDRLARDVQPADKLVGDGRAAVAVLLRLDDTPSVLLMQRTVRDGDPWSGHVSFPGGRYQAGDGELLETAIRETREELAVDLRASSRLVGAMPPIQAIGRGRVVPMTVTPFVFVEETPVEPVTGAEAEHVFWFPIADAAGGRFDGTFRYEHVEQKQTLDLPCWRYETYVVWGLTYRMLRDLIATVTA
jgi:8-oxo-dGTP pyrophosphatase MutT (NUDIX family)